MDNLDNITLCLTIGKRPDELDETLTHLLARLPFKHIIAINDFGDEATNDIFKKHCPNGTLISLGYNLGHHQAIDYMYDKITTEYVFHCEDDWLFDDTPNIAQCLNLLNNNSNISCVAFRKIENFLYDPADQAQIKVIQGNDGDYVRVDHLHDEWHGYSFNPHLAKVSLWREYAPFAKFKKERHISRHLRKQGLYMAFFKQGYCHHIGHDSVSNPPKSFWQKLKFW